jgi:hypothetical protein
MNGLGGDPFTEWEDEQKRAELRHPSTPNLRVVSTTETRPLYGPNGPHADTLYRELGIDLRSQAEKDADGAALLNDVYEFLGRFVAYPSNETRIAHTLWIAHTHLMDVWESTPRLAFLSPEPGSGKTRALEVSELLVPNPIEAWNVTPAYLFRKVGSADGRPTVLFDEIDTVFGPKAKENEEIRGLINAGHRRGAVAGRCVIRGREVTTEEIPAYCAVAVAGLGSLPDSILTRAVIIRMRKRAPREKVEPFRRRKEQAYGNSLRNRLAKWAALVKPSIDGKWPDLPEGVTDRAADVWEPLLSVADAAGGDWPDIARGTAGTLVTLVREEALSLGTLLLADMRQIWDGAAAMHSVNILAALHVLTEAPWADLRGKPLTDRGLARLLSPYGVKPTMVRIGEVQRRGYMLSDLEDAWARYLPPPLSERSVPSVPSVPAALVRHD